jgi:hypothetical protein
MLEWECNYVCASVPCALCAKQSIGGSANCKIRKQKSTFCFSQGKGEGQKENDRKTKEREKLGC